MDFLLKIARFWNIILNSYLKKQDWSLHNKVIWEKKNLELRQFNFVLNNTNPILIIPPNAGHHSNIAEKLISTCIQEAPNRNIYCINWKGAKRNDDGYSIEDMVNNLSSFVEFLDEKVHLFTLCQGAWLGAIYAALNPRRVKSYTNAAGPIDFRHEDSKIKQYCDILPNTFFRNLVYMNSGIHTGENQLLGFKNMNPGERYVGDYLDLWSYIVDEDEDKIDRWRKFKEWYEYTLSLNGKWYLEAVEHLFKENKLINKELKIFGVAVDLSYIDFPVYLLAGGRDEITLPEQVFNMEKYVNGKVTKYLIEDAGHIGVFTKSESLEKWSEIIDSLNYI